MYRRLISAGLSISMLLGAMTVTGCKKKQKQENVRKVSPDTSWYEASIFSLGDKYKDKNIKYFESNIIGVYNDGLVIENRGYEMPADSDGDDINEACEFTNIDYYTLSGEQVSSVDVEKVIDSKNDTGVYDIYITKDGVKLKIFGSGENEGKIYEADIDVANGKIGNLEEPATSRKNNDKTSNMFLYGTWEVGEYSVSCYDKMGGNYSCIISKNGESKYVDLSADPAFTEVAYVSGCIIVSDTKILLVCLVNGTRFASIDLENGRVKDVTEEYSWLKTINYETPIASFEGKTYIVKQDGIKCINLEKKELEEVVSFDNFNINRYSLADMELLSVKDGKFIFAGDIGDEASKGLPTIAVLEKQETNPHAGKTIITAGAVRNADVSYAICEAVRTFNNTNENYFIQMVYDYDLKSRIDYKNAQTDDEIADIVNKTAAELDDLLAIDMLAGDGPDIILNAGTIRQIQTEKHLVDLSSYAKGKNGINADECFSNIIDAATNDGKLLYIPVSFKVSGLLVKKKDARDGQIGFTYDEYAKYVSETQNGTDPMSDTQLGITCTLFSYLYGKCIQGDSVNFDNESFRKMCEYVKNNVPEKSHYNYDFDGNASCEGLYYFLERHTYNSTKNTILGYPTPDGCGPYITVDTSVGISAFAPSSVVDGAWEFIKTCLSEKAQAVIAEGDTNPINKNVYDSSAGKALEKYNKSDVSFGIPMDESVITSYKEILESATVIASDDPAVLNIIREEIPAYYLDQKSLDAVISIINNRVTTVIAERTTNVKNAK